MSARKLVLAVLVSMWALGVGSGSADAAPNYGSYEDVCGEFANSVLCSGTTAIPMAGILGLAVDNSSGPYAGDVYFAGYGGAGASTVSRFTANGEPAPFTGTHNPALSGNQLELGAPGEVAAIMVAVESETGDFYVTTRLGNRVERYSPEGEHIAEGSFALPEGISVTGIAVDNSSGPSRGDIYVADEAATIYKFDKTGTELGSVVATGGVPLYSMAVGVHGELYADEHLDDIEKYSENLVAEGVLDQGHESEAVTVDPSTGDVLVEDNGPAGSYVQPYSEDGTPLSAAFGEGAIADGGSYGLAASASNHEVYAGDLGNGLTGTGVIYGIGEVTGPPTEVKTEPASEVRASTAKLNGELNPGGAAKYYFEYGTKPCTTPGTCIKTAEGAQLKSEVQIAAGAIEINSLIPGTTYYFKITGINRKGTVEAANEETFTTEPAPPQARTETATEVTTTSAELNGEINPGGAATNYYFEYGAEPCGANTCGAKTVEGGPIAGSARKVIEGIEVQSLQPGRTYSYWVVASNGKGTSHGEEKTFTTEPGTVLSAPPILSTRRIGSGAPPLATLPTTIVTTTPTPKPAPPKPTTKHKTLTRAQKLANALKACKRDKQKGKRTTCERQARKKYARRKGKSKQ